MDFLLFFFFCTASHTVSISNWLAPVIPKSSGHFHPLYLVQYCCFPGARCGSQMHIFYRYNSWCTNWALTNSCHYWSKLSFLLPIKCLCFSLISPINIWPDMSIRLNLILFSAHISNLLKVFSVFKILLKFDGDKLWYVEIALYHITGRIWTESYQV